MQVESLFAVAGFGAVEARENDKTEKKKCGGDHGVGSLDGEVEDFAVAKLECVIERDGAAGKLAGHCDRHADVVAAHGRAPN